MPDPTTMQATDRVYTVTIRGQDYTITNPDPVTILFLALINLNNPRINAVFTQLQVNAVINGKPIFPHVDTHRPSDRLLSVLRRLLYPQKPAHGDERTDQEAQTPTKGSGAKTPQSRRNKKSQS